MTGFLHTGNENYINAQICKAMLLHTTGRAAVVIGQTVDFCHVFLPLHSLLL